MIDMASKKPNNSPIEVAEICHRLGARIRTARLQRKWRQQDVVERTGYSRSTVLNVEKGDPKTALGIYLHILWLMGLAREIELVADPGLDREGLAIALDAANKRVYLPRKVRDDF